jgi:hypothetical protein
MALSDISQKASGSRSICLESSNYQLRVLRSPEISITHILKIMITDIPAEAGRILHALKVAQENKCGVFIILNPNLFKENRLTFSTETITDATFAIHDDEILIIKNDIVIYTFSWVYTSYVDVIWKIKK